MTLLQAAVDFGCLVLASWALLDAWFSGTIFASGRSWLQRVVRSGPRGRWAEVGLCPFCLSYHLPWILGMCCVLPGLIWPAVALGFKLPLYSLAATRIVWLLNEHSGDRVRVEL